MMVFLPCPTDGTMGAQLTKRISEYIRSLLGRIHGSRRWIDLSFFARFNCSYYKART